MEDRTTSCLNCGVPVRDGVCGWCDDLPYDRGYSVGVKDDMLLKAIEIYKYRSTKALYVPLAELLEGALPCLHEDTVVVPIPTNSKHVRTRGLDHTWLMAKELARLRNWESRRWVARVINSVQVGSDKKTRERQAKEAYRICACEQKIKDSHIVVIDDVWTTGSSMRAVCSLLRDAGAKSVTVAVLLRA